LSGGRCELGIRRRAGVEAAWLDVRTARVALH